MKLEIYKPETIDYSYPLDSHFNQTPIYRLLIYNEHILRINIWLNDLNIFIR